MKEIWEDVRGYEGLYQVSNFGNVKSLNYNKTKQEKILKPKTSSAYNIVCLCKNGNNKYCSIHRLVANAFIPNPYSYSDINHIDGNKRNNSVKNLEWVSRSENMKHACYKLNKNPREWSKTKVRCIETQEVFETQTEAAKKYKTSQGAIGNAARKNRPKAGGVHWEFIKDIGVVAPLP